MRVEQFSIGFPPKIFSFKYGETVYSIGCIPLGGFVKITGMIDESLDTKSLSEEPQPWEFRSKPAWQRLIVMMGGIIVNVIVGMVVFVFLIYYNGESYISKSDLNKNGIAAYTIAQKEVGLRDGDKIISVNGKDYVKMSDLLDYDVLLNDHSYYEVDRNGQMLKLPIPVDLIEKLSDETNDESFIFPQTTFWVDSILENKGAEYAGIEKGDIILSAKGKQITYYKDLQDVLKESKEQIIPVKILRKEKSGIADTILKDVQISTAGEIGIAAGFPFKPTHISYTFGESMIVGPKKAFMSVIVTVQAFGRMFQGKLDPRKSLKGPFGIMQQFGYTWDWFKFWSLTGLLSMILAFMNFLPIPALDGGHVAFLSYEIISGRKPSDKFLENAQKVGMVMLLMLMAFVIINDFLPK
jgi:regulator of sigma E protease